MSDTPVVSCDNFLSIESAVGLRIPYRTLTATLDLESGGPVSGFLASTIRGGFGYTLKRLVCTFKGTECTACILKNNCVYPFLFETAPESDAVRLKKYLAIPRPFALRPFQNGSCVTLELLLVGKAVEMLPFFVYTLNELGKNGLGKNKTPFIVSSIVDKEGLVVYNGEHKNECRKIQPVFLELTQSECTTTEVKLHFDSPLVLRKDNSILDKFDTRTFFSNLLRRITNINAFYGENREFALDTKPYFDAVNALSCETDMQPVQQQRISTRQKQTIDYSGITGTVKFRGALGPLMPYLRVGEVLGVGKNTVFGYGVYGVEE